MKNKKILNFRPVLFFTLSLLCGILFSYFLIFNNVVCAVVLLGLNLICNCLFIFINFDLKQLKKRLIFSLLFLTCFFIGFSTFSTQVNNYKDSNLNGHTFLVKGRVEELTPTNYGNAILLGDVYLNGIITGKTNYKILVYSYTDTPATLGDIISFSAPLLDRTLLYEGRFCADAIAENIRWTASLHDTDITVLGSSATLFQKCNLFIKNSLFKGLEKDQAGVGYALLTGNCDYFSNYLLYNFRSLGIAHIFAVSGLHIGFLSVALTFVLRKLKVKNLYSFFIITLCLFTYSGICGFTSSSLRASIMCSCSLFSRVLGARSDGVSSLSLAGFLILLFNPAQLFCVGFILSFSVVLGILLLTKFISKLLKFLPKKLNSAISVVLASCLASLPILNEYFGYVSLISIVANLIFIPLISVVFTLLLCSAIIGGIFGIENVILFPSNYIIKTINLIVGAIDYKIFTIGLCGVGMFCLLYYVALLVPCGFFNFKNTTKIVVSLVCSLCFLFSVVYINASTKDKVNCTVIGSDTTSCTLFTKQDQNLLIVQDASYVFSLTALKRTAENFEIDKIETVIILNDGKEKDLQNFSTRLYSALPFDKIMFSDQCNITGVDGFIKSFPFVSYEVISDNQELRFFDLDFTLSLDGYCMLVSNADRQLGLFAKYSSTFVNFYYLSATLTDIIAVNYLESISTLHKNANLISTVSSSQFLSAQNQRYISFNI